MAKQTKIRSDAKSLKMNHPEGRYKGLNTRPQITLDSIPWDENGHRGVDIEIGVDKRSYPHITIGQHKDGDMWVSLTSFIQDEENPGKMKYESTVLDSGTVCHTSEMEISDSNDPYSLPRLSVNVSNFITPKDDSENNKGVA